MPTRILRFLLLTNIVIGSASVADAAPTLFLTPADFLGHETLITFDDLGLSPPAEIRSGGDVGFELLELGTLIDTGFGPRSRARRTVPTRGSSSRVTARFLNTINFSVDAADLEIDCPLLVSRAAAEIRSGQTGNVVSDLTFELYRQGLLVGAMTVPIRGQDDFFFYGIASPVSFDSWVIRQRPDDRFALENLRFIPEPGTLLLTVTGLTARLVRRRRRSH